MSRDDLRGLLVDLGFLLALSSVALVGLAPTFTGPGFAVVGLVGLLLGAGAAVLAVVRGWPAVVPVLAVVVLFLLLGGPLCLRAEGGSAYLPGPATVGTLLDRLLFGWKDLLTTLPPVDGDGTLLVLPWTLGLVTGLVGGLLLRVRRGRRRPALLVAALPLLAPLLLLAAVILLGVRHPHSLLLQGTAVALLAVTWLSLRLRRVTAGASPAATAPRTDLVRRLVAGGALLAVAAAVAVPVSGWVLGSDGERVVLRTYVEPPFDIGRYPSPLASFRRYVEMPEPDAVNLYDRTMFEVDGAPAGTRLRLATLDTYDGIVWGAGGDPVPGSTVDTFQRVSSTIDNPAAGDPVRATVTVGEGGSGVWLPTVGAVQSLRFAGQRAETSAESFRYNLATATGVVPTGLRAGDRYTMVGVVPEDATASPDDAPASILPDLALAAGFLDNQSVQWSAGEAEPMARVFAVAEHLKREGKYSDGVRQDERIYHAGHHLKRLSDEFVNAPIMVGNDEQYAAVMALLANRIGVPARVVLGAVVPEGGVVQGRDVQAWVELQVADGSWRTLPTETFMDYDRPAEQPPQTEQQMSGVVVPPPAPIPPPSTTGEQTDAELKARKNPRDDEDDAGGLPGWLKALLLYGVLPLLVVAALLGSVVLLKAWRRRRRRTAERTSAQVVGGWRELVDHARDLGRAVPVAGGVTRREQSALLGTETAPDLARTADSLVFGPAVPPPDAAAAYWRAVDAERRALSRAVPWHQRFLAAINPATLRPTRTGRLPLD